MKINDIANFNQAIGEAHCIIFSTSPIILLAQRAFAFYELDAVLHNLTKRLKELKFDNFQILFKGGNRFELVDFDVQIFENELDAWAEQEGGKAEKAAEEIKRVFHDNETCLSLIGFDLNTLPPQIGALANLKCLRLDFNKLRTLPDTIGDLVHLSFLRLYNNKLTSVPETIGKLKYLERLDLHKNELTTLPDSIGDLTKLKSLSVEENQLTNVPDSIANLVNLKNFFLCRNQLTDLNPHIGRLDKLEFLELTVNPNLTTLPLALRECTHLKYLHCDESLGDQVRDILSMCKAKRDDSFSSQQLKRKFDSLT